MKHTIIVGAGKSGLAVARHLFANGVPSVLTDSNPNPDKNLLSQLAEWEVQGFWGSHPITLLDNANEVVLSPVINPNIPFVQEAIRRGIPVIGELELAHRVLRAKDPTAIILAITGTNGKSTTTDLTAHLLKSDGIPAIACGNIGHTFLDAVNSAESGSRFVVECSSYQLETVHSFRADGATILNLTPDHLQRHGTMTAYLKAKLRIFERQVQTDLSIIPSNADFQTPASPCSQMAKFGWHSIEGQGAWCDQEGNLLFRSADEVITNLINRSELLIPGDHNVENSLVAILLATHGGATVSALRLGLRTYPGLRHRLAFCGEKDGIRAYNDSKGTNVEATLTAIHALNGPIILLLGGEDKGSSYCPLINALDGKLKQTIFLGDAIPMLVRDLGNLPHYICKDFDGAVARAFELAIPGDQILLSPACASFDQFKNFEARGERFEYLVNEWIASK
ncbi:MAG: UDP-N-acetylmuramoyl-L-alanine--D-glutamate ligase [Holophagaceae bacterium]|nr:UDP-N-acetylmuramoyl-L-alanine--D-glutamate ligase [Holophagaceae bacterium]